MNKVKLKDICRLINGRAYKQNELLDSGKYPVLRVGNFFSDKDFYYSDLELDEEKYCNNGDLLFAWSASFGPKIWNGGKAIYHYHIWKMELTDNVDRDYLFYYLYYLSERIKAEGHGGIMIHTTKTEMEKREFILPELNTQKRIAELFARISNVIKEREQEIQKLDEIISSRFVELFGDAVYNDKKWKTDTVKNLCKEIYGGGTPSKAHPEYYKDGDIPWVSAKDMKTDVLKDSQIKINQLGVDNSTARLVPVNSVIMVIRSGILKHTLPVAVNKVPITVNQDLKVFIPGERILTRFLAVQFKMQEKDILSGVRAVTADNIEFNSLKQRRMIVPPIDLQQKYLMFLERIDKSKFEVQKSLEKTQLLFNSLMQEYFG